MTSATNSKTWTTITTITTDNGTASSDYRYPNVTGAGEPWEWIEPNYVPFEEFEPLPPFFCPKHKEIGEDIIEVVEKDGKKHYYCRKCVEEIIKKRAKEVDRWEDELTKHDFEEET